MLFERVVSEGIEHYSYILGEGGEAVVIDPRCDIDIYIEIAQKAGVRITDILETHRNEDYLVGSAELAQWTKASVWHADSQWDYKYGKDVVDGQTWHIGALRIISIAAPGHTPGMMMYLLCDQSDVAWILFSGDALFAGDVGRTDLLGTAIQPHMAQRLYDTIFAKILPLGDGIILCPAHGSGSVCGGDISERLWSTIGLERLHNPKLQFGSREAFVDSVAKPMEIPPYFKQMEQLNLEGGIRTGFSYPQPLRPQEFFHAMHNAIIVDTRPVEAFAAAHIPGALSLWLDGLAGFAGWFVPYNTDLLLVGETATVMRVFRILQRLGFRRIRGYGTLTSWLSEGYKIQTVNTISVHEFCACIDSGDDFWILDVRSSLELHSEGRIPDAHHIHITQLNKRYTELPQNRDIFIFCGSGRRSMIAASILQQKQGYQPVVIMGGFSGWSSIACPVDKG